MTPPMWQAPPEPLDMPERTVDLWRLSLTQPARLIDDLAGLLTTEETARAQRFRFARDQNCYTLTRGALRLLLGDYLERSPREVSFVTGEHGKPALPDSLQPPKPLEFNVSHSGDYALLAFARSMPVGVDVEEIRPRKSLDLVAEHHFSPEEQDALLGEDDEELLQRFYRCWTRKEAYMKATGEGVVLGLKSFAVSVEEPARLLWTDRGDVDTWQMADVAADEGYAGAVCVGSDGPIEIRRFEVSRRRYIER